MAILDVHFMSFHKMVHACGWLQAPALTGQFPANSALLGDSCPMGRPRAQVLEKKGGLTYKRVRNYTNLDCGIFKGRVSVYRRE